MYFLFNNLFFTKYWSRYSGIFSGEGGVISAEINAACAASTMHQ